MSVATEPSATVRARGIEDLLNLVGDLAVELVQTGEFDEDQKLIMHSLTDNVELSRYWTQRLLGTMEKKA
jgi:hypothetical protein